MSKDPAGWVIEYYSKARGDCPVIEYIASLSDQEQAKIDLYLRHLKDRGTELGMPFARPVKGRKPLWELRPMPHRIVYFAFSGRRFVLLHAFRKGRMKKQREHFDLAERRRQEIAGG